MLGKNFPAWHYGVITLLPVTPAPLLCKEARSSPRCFRVSCDGIIFGVCHWKWAVSVSAPQGIPYNDSVHLRQSTLHTPQLHTHGSSQPKSKMHPPQIIPTKHAGYFFTSPLPNTQNTMRRLLHHPPVLQWERHYRPLPRERSTLDSLPILWLSWVALWQKWVTQDQTSD